MSISKGTIVRSVMLLVGVVNTVCVLFGWSPVELDESLVYEAVSTAYMVVVTAWSWWKNNSFSHAAVSADSVKNMMKSGMSLIETIEALTDRRDSEDMCNVTED